MPDRGEQPLDADHIGIEYEEALVFSLSGVVDAATVPEIVAAIREEMNSSRPGLVVNLTGVAFLDSSAIGMLFDLADRLARRRQRYAVVAPSAEPIRSVLLLAGLDEVTHLTESVAEALGLFEPDAD